MYAYALCSKDKAGIIISTCISSQGFAGLSVKFFMRILNILLICCAFVCEASLKRGHDRLESADEQDQRNVRRRVGADEGTGEIPSNSSSTAGGPLPLQILVVYQLIDYRLERLPHIQEAYTNFGMDYFGCFFRTGSVEIDLEALVKYAIDKTKHRYANEYLHLNRVFLKTYGISAEDFAVLYKKDSFRVHFERLQNRWLSQAFGIILSPNAKNDILFEVFAERHPAIRYGPEFVLKHCAQLSLISPHLLEDYFVTRIETNALSPRLIGRMIQLRAPEVIINALLFNCKSLRPRIFVF